MTWTVVVAKPAQKQVAKFPASDQHRIAGAIRDMASGPFWGDVIKLEGAGNRWRRPVGNYRIFYAVDQAGMAVCRSGRIVRRTSTTYY